MKIKYNFYSIENIAKAISKCPHDITFDFTFDSKEDIQLHEPEAWYGIKRTSVFAEEKGILCMGYYGGGTTVCKELVSASAEEIEELFIDYCRTYIVNNINKNYELCVEITDGNKNFLPIITNFDFCTNDELGDYFAFAETVVDLEKSNSINFTKDFDRDVELAELFRESYKVWPRGKEGYSEFVEDFLISKQEMYNKEVNI